MVTYWVDYSFTYEYFDTDENDWMECEDFDADRFHCLKKHILGTNLMRFQIQILMDYSLSTKIILLDTLIWMM